MALASFSVLAICQWSIWLILKTGTLPLLNPFLEPLSFLMSMHGTMIPGAPILAKFRGRGCWGSQDWCHYFSPFLKGPHFSTYTQSNKKGPLLR